MCIFLNTKQGAPQRERSKKLNYDVFDTFLNVIFMPVIFWLLGDLVTQQQSEPMKTNKCTLNLEHDPTAQGVLLVTSNEKKEKKIQKYVNYLQWIIVYCISFLFVLFVLFVLIQFCTMVLESSTVFQLIEMKTNANMEACNLLNVAFTIFIVFLLNAKEAAQQQAQSHATAIAGAAIVFDLSRPSKQTISHNVIRIISSVIKNTTTSPRQIFKSKEKQCISENTNTNATLEIEFEISFSCCHHLNKQPSDNPRALSSIFNFVKKIMLTILWAISTFGLISAMILTAISFITSYLTTAILAHYTFGKNFARVMDFMLLLFPFMVCILYIARLQQFHILVCDLGAVLSAITLATALGIKNEIKMKCDSSLLWRHTHSMNLRKNIEQNKQKTFVDRNRNRQNRDNGLKMRSHNLDSIEYDESEYTQTSLIVSRSQTATMNETETATARRNKQNNLIYSSHTHYIDYKYKSDQSIKDETAQEAKDTGCQQEARDTGCLNGA